MHICQLITLFSASSALFLNLLLVPIIITKSSERLGVYKYFLLAYTLNASIFTFSQAATLPNWYIPSNGYAFLSTITILPREIQQILIVSFILSYVGNAIVITWSFLYRLAVIETPHPWVVRATYIPWELLGSFLFVCYMGTSLWPLMPTERNEQLFQEVIYEATGANLSEVGHIAGEITIDGKVNIGMAVCLLSFATMVVFESCVVLFCWNKIGSKLRELRSLASIQYKFQYRLYILLSLQTVMPIIFNVLPALIVFILSLAKVHVGDAVLVCGMVLSFAQIADPIFTILLVTDYKEALISWRNRLIFKQVAPTETYVTSSVAPSSFAVGCSVLQRKINCLVNTLKRIYVVEVVSSRFSPTVARI